MKRTLTFMSLLLCVFATISAQTTVKRASNEATPFDQLESGVDYAIQVASDKNYQSKTDFSTAKFLYASDNRAYTDGRTNTYDCRYNSITNDNYIWTITVNDDESISIQSKGSGTYFPAPNNNGENDMTLGSTAGKFKKADTSSDEWCILYCKTGTNVTANFSNNGSAGGSNNSLDFWTYNSDPTKTALARFKFFKIEETSSDQLATVTITYNYTINDKKVYTTTRNCYTDRNYPPHPFILGTYTKVDKIPEGKPTDNETISLALDFDFDQSPVRFSLNETDTPSWGYLTINISTSDRRLLTDGGTYIARMAANGNYQNPSLNGIKNDLWRFVGDPFNGFKIINKSGRYLVKQSGGNGAILANPSTTESDNLWKIYGGDIIDTPNNITDENKEELKKKAFVVRHSTVGEGSNYLDGGTAKTDGLTIGTWNKRSNGSCMLFLEPEFSVDLHAATDASYATFCMPIDCKIVGTETTKAYTGKYGNGSLNMSEITDGIIPAGQGVVLKNTDNNVTSVKFTANAKATATSLNNDLMGTTTEIAFGDLSDKLVFGRSEGGVVGFYAAGGTAALPANRAYLNQSLLNGVGAVAMNFNPVATGISNIRNNNKVNAPIYDLTGRRVFNTTKGNLYIQNGSKFIAR